MSLSFTGCVGVSEGPPEVWLLICNLILNSTEDPNKSPLSFALCNWGNITVTFTASLPVDISCETPPFATVQSAALKPLLKPSLPTIPAIFDWLLVPSLVFKTIFWKL